MADVLREAADAEEREADDPGGQRERVGAAPLRAIVRVLGRGVRLARRPRDQPSRGSFTALAEGGGRSMCLAMRRWRADGVVSSR